MDSEAILKRGVVHVTECNLIAFFEGRVKTQDSCMRIKFDVLEILLCCRQDKYLREFVELAKTTQNLFNL
jgi:hypothetical protein